MKERIKKSYWINYLGYWAIFVFIVFMFSDYDLETGYFDFKYGFLITCIISNFFLAHFVAKKYSRDEKIDELRTKEGLSYEEFNLKYGKLLDVLD